MKKIILIFALALTSVAVNANEKEKELAKSTNPTEFIMDFQDCEDYANRASRREVGIVQTILDGGIARAISYGYWLGVCESHDPSDGELLDPVFL